MTNRTGLMCAAPRAALRSVGCRGSVSDVRRRSWSSFVFFVVAGKYIITVRLDYLYKNIKECIVGEINFFSVVNCFFVIYFLFWT